MGGLGGGVAGQGPQKPSHPDRVAPGSAGVVHIGAVDLVEVVAAVLLGGGSAGVDVGRPAASAQHPGHIGEAHLGGRARCLGCRQQAAQRDRAVGVARLEQRHRPEPDPGDAPRAGVARGVVGWNGRPGQDELSRPAPLVTGAANMVPHRRSVLPFVQQPRLGPCDDLLGVEFGQGACVAVNIETHFAAGLTARRGRLARPAGPLDHHRRRSPQPGCQKAIDDPVPVFHRQHGSVSDQQSASFLTSS